MSAAGADGPVDQAELHAWLDGELPEARRAAIARHLADHPDERARLESYRRQQDLLARALAPLAAEGAGFVRRPRRRILPAIAAALLLLALGGVAGWALRGAGLGPADAPAFVADALAAHRVFTVEVRHPVEVGADQEAHLVAWLSKRLGAPVLAPDLRPAGFRLVGGRLLHAGAMPAALLMYEDAGQRRVTLYIRRAAEPVAAEFRFAEADGASAFYWKEGSLGWALAGEMQRDELLRLAHAVHRALGA